MKIKKKLLIASYLLFIGCLYGQDLSLKANTFLNSLQDDLKSKAVFEIDEEERYNFNYVPIVRKGPTFHDFTKPQKAAALELLKASLSENGFNKSKEIMALENILIQIEKNKFRMPDGSPMRDPLNYHFSIFGKPAPDQFWGWRFEGHHLSLNFTSAEGKIISATPSFMGSNPGVVMEGEHKGKEVLRSETQLGLELINALSESQSEKAIFSNTAPREIITGNQRKVKAIERKGIPFTELNEKQKEMFLQLLEVYIGNYVFEFSETFRAKIANAGHDNLYFAWAGDTVKGRPHYYRIHGPMLLIEYDNIQNNANHVHTVVRDLNNDFAEDLLRQHYNQKH
ncbi:DUF3500 domain-containing protein [Muriicola sp. Z0-33]|uniref:DUF3500 domain-containing protein n=1 Tax=Muriicola sp. Z0-33 TaxID=2816957 RepID=UPI002238BE5F|nr:DUF3500 domain-containing protein [Muriicola sp. Z0-33]MCW5515934.1 DUF3500 domain-containing protein [Muriicola sp. Z0-33]